MRWLIGFVLLLLALGTLRTVGCGDEASLPECRIDADCDDQNECTTNYCVEESCGGEPVGVHLIFRNCDFDGVQGLAGEDGICSEEGRCLPSPCDDSNDCTRDSGPRVSDGECFHEEAQNGAQPCDRNGTPGVCVDGVCLEYRCNDGVICNDGDLCTDDRCDHTDWACKFTPRCRDKACEYASCDPTDGSCYYRNKPDGTPCRSVSMFCPSGADVYCEHGDCICHLGSSEAFEVQP